jgi:hypothetical protein
MIFQQACSFSALILRSIAKQCVSKDGAAPQPQCPGGLVLRDAALRAAPQHEAGRERGNRRIQIASVTRIDAGVPGGKGRGSTSTSPRLSRTRYVVSRSVNGGGAQPSASRY